MTAINHSLPQLGQQLFLTDGGLETTMIFHEGFELPEFASFVMLDSESGRETLQNYYRRYLDIAANSGAGFVLEAATWRASRDWGEKIGYSGERLAEVNRSAVRMLQSLKAEYADRDIPIVISGNIGPRGDGYVVGQAMSAEEATAYHSVQAEIFAAEGVDVVTAMTMNYPEEAIGVVRAAAAVGLPAVIGFTTETDGRLPSEHALRDAIETVDRESDGGPAYYMINCAHTEHFDGVLEEDGEWTTRIRGVRANASRMSHAELDEAEELDDGDPEEFGSLHQELKARFPKISVFGGCCGTDHRHVSAVSAALA